MFAKITPELVDDAAQLPVLRQILCYLHWRRFCAASGPVRLFYGIYPDFPTAERDIPHGRLVGYDNEPSAVRLADERFRISPRDYPILFWLQQLLPGCRLLFDFGGNVGISYFGFRQYLKYSPTLTWLVYDVPAVAALGERIAREESAQQLRFTRTLDALGEADILMALGSLQFVAMPFDMLRATTHLPKHVLLNKVPVRELPGAVTLHNMGSAFCPYHLFNRQEFVQGFQSLGYELVDQWENPDLRAYIPLHRRDCLDAYSGYYFHKPEVPAAGQTFKSVCATQAAQSLHS
jgi:putative methyltransferase (TIGR04325 family)